MPDIKPILFNTQMVRAILAGTKMVTRRVVRPYPMWQKLPVQQVCYSEYWTNWDDEKFYKAPYFPGDILYVRETWAVWSRTTGTPPALYYKADEDTPDGIKWHPSIHMPREAARIFLLVTGVRVERLQDMQPYDIAFEGFRRERDLKAFWDSTIKPADRDLYGWEADPWVWVIEFERVSKSHLEQERSGANE